MQIKYLIIFFLLFLSACQSVTNSLTKRANTTEIPQPTKDQSIVYFYSEKPLLNAVFFEQIGNKFKKIGIIDSRSGGSFFFTTATPGKHIYALIHDKRQLNIAINVKSNNSHFIKTNIKVDKFFNINQRKLSLEAQQTGRKAISNLPYRKIKIQQDINDEWQNKIIKSVKDIGNNIVDKVKETTK